MSRMSLMGLMGRMFFLLCFLVVFPLGLWAQEYETVIIGGNVYGGGNQGKVEGNTTVTVRAGDLNKVFGGSRMADVGGRSFLNVDGENASADIFIVEGYGGNDISGTIGQSGEETTVPAELTDILSGSETKETHPKKNAINKDWKTFVRTTRSIKTDENGVVQKNSEGKPLEGYSVFIGSLFGGGNGDYDYEQKEEDGKLKHYIYNWGDKDSYIAYKETLPGEVGFQQPIVPRTYLELKGGSIVHVYGGGNNATVTENTTISIANESDDIETQAKTYAEVLKSQEGTWPGAEHHSIDYYTDYVIGYLLDKIKLATFQGNFSNWKFNFARVFGGNNKADMAIRPKWNLQQGMINDLYSGGNRGRMIYHNGLFLNINPEPVGTVEDAKKNRYPLVVENVYGGCRMADVRPMVWDPDLPNPETGENGGYKDVSSVDNTDDSDYYFPLNFAARVIVSGGDINNVYGGNDIQGKVYFGNAVGITTSIRGNVYGGGNGAYAYTDNPDLEQDPQYSDFYYSKDSETDAATALLSIRPDAEQVSIMIRGEEEKPTIIGGSVFVGGNCATLEAEESHRGLLKYPLTELKLGSYVYVDNVYLGNNGEGMISDEVLDLYANGIKVDEGHTISYNTMNLLNSQEMITYMEGVTMNHIPILTVENESNGDRQTYKENTSYIGSLFLGGNVGSMTYAGKNSMKFDVPIIVYNKVVGGCNKANVPAGTYNARYEGGILGSTEERFSGGVLGAADIPFTDSQGNIKDRLELNFEGLHLEPKRWKVKRDPASYQPILTTDGKPIYLDEEGDELSSIIATCPTCTASGKRGHAYLEWNTVKHVDKQSLLADGTHLIAGKTYYTYDSVNDKYNEHIATGTEVQGVGETDYYEWTHDFVDTENGSGENVLATNEDKERRLLGGHVYGGCYESGHVNGNVTINLKESLHERKNIFDKYKGEDEGEDILYEEPEGGYYIEKRNSGVILDKQGMDVLGDALNVFGGGYGKEAEIWGSTTINLTKGYTFQIFGGGELGAIGKAKKNNEGEYILTEGEFTYEYDKNYSTTINMHGTRKGESRSEDVKTSEVMAESEFIYGGGFEGPIAGNTQINLGNGRIFNSFAGCCNADVLGHTETYVGRGGVNATTKVETPGFPWVRDYVYGGNDLGGEIQRQENFVDRVRDAGVKALIHNPQGNPTPDVVKASAYMEYTQGHAFGLYGGHFGDYDYTEEYKDVKLPWTENTFVNFRPTDTPLMESGVAEILGGSEGYSGFRDGDKTQDHSYVLIDIPQGMTNFLDTEVYGAGSNNGLGMRYSAAETFADGFDPDKASAIIDLLHGQIGAVYGGAHNEGVTRRTVVNVPATSTIDIGNIFGGAYGTQVLPPCDVYESHVNYRSEAATVRNAIYGGNNNERRTLYAHVNISVPVWQNRVKGYLATVYGAGRGQDTWAEYTEVNLENGAKVYEVYGGSEDGHVMNAECVLRYMQDYWYAQGCKSVSDPEWLDAWTLGDYYTPALDAPGGLFSDYLNNSYTNLNNPYTHDKYGPLVRTAEMDDRDYSAYSEGEKAKRQYKYNTNVIINKGAHVVNYAYGGGLGTSTSASLYPGDVWGTTYIALLGGMVTKDIYAAGTSGGVSDFFGRVGRYDADENPGGFTASANAYIKGGTCRNVYGGGWKGSVGLHEGEISDSPETDIPGETHVVIGDLGGTTFTNGIPAIQRNVYGGGEGGAVYGSSYVTLNNGYVGYVHLNAGEKLDDESGLVVADADITEQHYEEKIIDDTYRNNGAYEYNENLLDAGCLFGGGYIDDSWVDKTHVTIYGGQVRNSAFGGGEIAAIGRGSINKTSGGGKITYTLAGLYRPGKTNIEMFGGHVRRNVYGGGRGYDNLGRHGSFNSDGFVFGQTEVHIHGGEIGTLAGLENGDGNVFGGGDIGFVYSAYENPDGSFGKGVKAGKRYNQGVSPSDVENYNYQGYYFQHAWGDGDFVTENIYYTQEEIDAAQEGDPAYGKTTSNIKGTERVFTEDCKVLIEPHCKVTDSGGVSFTGIHYKQGEQVSAGDLQFLKESKSSLLDDIDVTGKVTAEDGISFSRSYAKGDYVPIAALNTLKNKDADGTTWGKIDPSGIVIHNAVFAGGNTQPGSSAATYVNTSSIFGNATASINDVYNRDLITVGTNRTGGLYGDGNMTFVDGYRELNITNYGTDYYSIDNEISNNTYHNVLSERERAYYELKYKCINDCEDKDGTRYKKAVKDEDGKEVSKASTITADDLLALFLEDDGTSVRVDASGKRVTSSSGGTPVLEKDANGQWVPKSTYWEENGVVTAYAGRLMNTIQRADFCGVYGSRMVMKGAPDRVPEEADYTNYTINRVREVSLNKVLSPAGDTVEKDKEHGNYFGIYSVVNFLGALTSDFDFGDENDRTYKRTTDNMDKIKYKCDIDGGQAYGSASFYDWKKEWWKDRRRNNGNSHNKVALASGVYLEITTEQSTGTGLYEKDWGPITGVVELDLINVAPGIGGGFVYAQNIHGKRRKTYRKNTTLTALNRDAVTHWDFEYDKTDTSEGYKKDDEDGMWKAEWQTSGNFVHSTQTIIDDCYNISNKYMSGYHTPNGVPAHYWYIKGSVYVYDQYISAYTGVPNAYSETVDIPLTITAASHGQMTLLNVQPNYYAYKSSLGEVMEVGKKVVINDKEYYKNDPISFWDYFLLTPSERNLFVSETYVNCVTCLIDGKEYEAGTYILSKTDFETFKATSHTYTDAKGEPIQKPDKTAADTNYIFRSSNKMSHNTGYILTYDVNNPSVWDEWYTKENSSTHDKINTAAYTELTTSQRAEYNSGPTYYLNSTTGMVLGQRSYEVGDIIDANIYNTYEVNEDANGNEVLDEGEDANGNGTLDIGTKSKITSANGDQATFKRAYVVTQQVSIPDGSGHTIHFNPGSTVSYTDAQTTPFSGKVAEAFVCTSTIQLSKTDFIYANSKMTETEKNDYLSTVTAAMNEVKAGTGIMTAEEIKALSLTTEEKKELLPLLTAREGIVNDIVPAYYCTEGGNYGGNYYQSGKNYRGLEAWSSMSATDRENFVFNYDALDLLVDTTYTHRSLALVANKYQYDGIDSEGNYFDTYAEAQTNNPAGYSIPQPVDYTATFTPETSTDVVDLGSRSITVNRDGNPTPTTRIEKDDELTRIDFESLTNEQRHYSAIVMKDGKKTETIVDDATVTTYELYVVKVPFQIGSTPFAVGTVISPEAYEGLPSESTTSIDVRTFKGEGIDDNTTFYYCRESYEVNEHGNGVTVTDVYPSGSFNAGSEVKYDNGDVVPAGAVIVKTDYDNLADANQQKNFTIHGISPTETSTLYVSRESEIYDLSKEKIITVVYQYDYDEVQASGTVTPVSERHVVNIHIQFKSGVPIVEEIKKPDLILPGDIVTLKEPAVTPGAYELLGGGWELFETADDAESHTNGIEYNPLYNPLYWYQHNWYVAYYAKTYLGRTYSNHVPVSVANYHDIDEVISTKEHHMYVDHPDVLRPSKIYINDYSDEGRNGLDDLKQLFELSLLGGTTVDSDEDGVIDGGKPFEGHHLLNEHVKQAQNLEFFMRTDIERENENKTVPNPDYNSEDPESPEYITVSVPKPWVPIVGASGECFKGILHGDGHTIRNLDHSLFGKLCGDVYNLGVMGSFQGAGIVDEGIGYVESCWISTSSDKVRTDKPVFGNPNRDTSVEPYIGKPIQMVNCYYMEEDDEHTAASDDPLKTIAYTNHSESSTYGMPPTRKPAKSFYNGEVTYDLNSFYLNKRYYDGKKQSTGTTYKFLPANDDHTLPEQAVDGFYPTTGYAPYCDVGYVEERFADGDFRYAAGTIPEEVDPRYRVEKKKDSETGPEYEVSYFAPIWPDDYLFFGQALTYGYMDGKGGRALVPHQDVPSVLNRSDGRVDYSETGNRVYRAPAYFRNSITDIAHFNPHAHLAQHYKDDASILAYPHMTAIDFAGHKATNEVEGTYGQGTVDAAGDLPQMFYPPLLDDDGLSAINNWDETLNLLVYAPASTASEGHYKNPLTFDVLTNYFVDPVYNDYYDNSHGYRLVVEAPTYYVKGHLVQDNLTATNDHLLIDKEDFDCPISYAFTGDNRMWYQRKPDNYVEPVWSSDPLPVRTNTQGWESVSLPFSAELVTTHQKGEITHFYDGSENSKNNTGTKVGHEYWLREYNDIKAEADPKDATANFHHPSVLGTASKTVTNTFLWDYYYENTAVHNRKDENDDTYQEYYREPRTYSGYSRLAADTPYLIGFPSNAYYEFDLSGNFVPQNTAVAFDPDEIEKQVISFVSDQNQVIAVSDTKKEGISQTAGTGDKYYFKPNYLNDDDLTTTDYLLNSEGVCYKKVKSTGSAVPFRPYFRVVAPSPGKEFQHIYFSKETSRMFGQDDDDDITNTGRLYIRARQGKILVTSTLSAEKEVLIVNAAGALIDRYTIQPGETIETPIHNAGVYIVNKKKLSVRP